MAYLIVLRFNSATNAQQFVKANPNIDPQIVNSNQPTGTFVVVEPNTLSEMPQGDIFPGPQYIPIVTYNQQGYIINYQPGFNLNDLTLTTTDGQIIISQGVPSTDITQEQPPTDPNAPPPVPAPGPYDPNAPINPDLPIQTPKPDPNPIPIPKPYNPYDPFNPIDPTLPIDPKLVSLIYPEQTRFVVPPGVDPITAPDVPINPFNESLDRPESIWSDPLPHLSPSDLNLPSPYQYDPIIKDLPEILMRQSDLPDWEQEPLSLDKDIIRNPPDLPDTMPFSKFPEDRIPQSQQISYPGEGGGVVSNQPALFTIYVPGLGVMSSTNGVSFSQVATPIDNLLNLGQGGAISLSGPIYLNGLWIFSYQFDTGGGVFGDAIIYSYNGKNWNLGVMAPSTSDLFYAVNVPGHGTNPAGSNQVILSNAGHVPAAKIINITIPCINPANTPARIQNGDSDFFSIGDIIVDPAQGGGTLTFGGSSGFYAQNSLPPGITAVKFTNPGGTSDQVAYTLTPITQAIVTANFAGITFVTSLNQPDSSGSGEYFYGYPSMSGLIKA